MIRRPPISTLTESLYPCTTFHPISLLSSLARYRPSSLPEQARRAGSPLGPVLSAECWPPLCWEFSSFRSSICRSAAGLVRNGLLPPVRRDRSPIMRKVLALTLTSLLGACQLAPPHARPALPTAQDYPTSYAGDVVLGRRGAAISWG